MPFLCLPLFFKKVYLNPPYILEETFDDYSAH